MSTSTEHGQVIGSAPKPDDSIAHRELSLELRRSLVGLHAQALWLGMPTVAHFIEVAALAISESAHDPEAALGPPTGSDQPSN